MYSSKKGALVLESICSNVKSLNILPRALFPITLSHFPISLSIKDVVSVVLNGSVTGELSSCDNAKLINLIYFSKVPTRERVLVNLNRSDNNSSVI